MSWLVPELITRPVAAQAQPTPLPRLEPTTRQVELTRARLRAEVPNVLERWRVQRRSLDFIINQARICGDVVAHQADALFEGREEQGHVLEALSTGIAALSLWPGGVDALDVHFEADPASLGLEWK